MTLKLSIVTSFFVIGFSTISGKESIKDLRKNIRSIKTQKKSLQIELNKKKEQTKHVVKEIDNVNYQLTGLEEKIEDTSARFQNSLREQHTLENKLKIVTEELTEKRKQLRTRLRRMYKQGNATFLIALLRSKDLGDLAIRKQVLHRIAQKDRLMFNEILNLRSSIEQSKNQKVSLVKQVASLARQQEIEQSALKDTKQKKQHFLSQLTHQQKIILNELEQLETESKLIFEKIKQYQLAQRAKAQELPIQTGVFLRPVAGPIVSPFGMRMHPILNIRRMHNGIDIAARTGTPIRAAASGNVIESKFWKGYGNMVLIDHGGGISTLYAHCSKRLVSGGDSVQKGDIIAEVGSTGLSGGPHLHLEVRKDGQPINPLEYF